MPNKLPVICPKSDCHSLQTRRLRHIYFLKRKIDREIVKKLFVNVSYTFAFIISIIVHVTSEFGPEATESKFSTIVDKSNQKCRDKGKCLVTTKDEECQLVESLITKDNA